jgi:hypothetical protein
MSKELELLKDAGFAWQMASRGLGGALSSFGVDQEVVDLVLSDIKPIFHAAWNEHRCEIVSLDGNDDVDRANASIVKIVMYLLVEIARCKCELRRLNLELQQFVTSR